MPARAFLLGLFLLFGSAAAFASAQPTVRVKKAGENFRFELCDRDSCQPLGRDNGYTRAELENWKKFRENSTSDIAPMMFFAGAVSLTIASLVLFPFAAVATAGVVALGGFAYFFSQSPQVKARMPNDVYHEFQADPTLLPSLKEFLREIDEGVPVTDQNPRVLSGHVPQKNDHAPDPKEAKPGSPVNHAR